MGFKPLILDSIRVYVFYTQHPERSVLGCKIHPKSRLDCWRHFEKKNDGRHARRTLSGLVSTAPCTTRCSMVRWTRPSAGQGPQSPRRVCCQTQRRCDRTRYLVAPGPLRALLLALILALLRVLALVLALRLALLLALLLARLPSAPHSQNLGRCGLWYLSRLSRGSSCGGAVRRRCLGPTPTPGTPLRCCTQEGLCQIKITFRPPSSCILRGTYYAKGRESRVGDRLPVARGTARIPCDVDELRVRKATAHAAVGVGVFLDACCAEGAAVLALVLVRWGHRPWRTRWEDTECG